MLSVTDRMPKPFRHQYYDQLRKQSIKTGKLFEDTEFPANSKSLFYSKIETMIEWMRPSVCYIDKDSALKKKESKQ